MEIFDYLETANFLKFHRNKKGDLLTDEQKIRKIINMIQNKTLPRDLTSTLGGEIIIIREELEKFIESRRGMKSRQK